MKKSAEVRLSEQRDAIYDWASDRFTQLIHEERVDDAIAFADEFYEWLDPEQLFDEETLYSDYNEIREAVGDQ